MPRRWQVWTDLIKEYNCKIIAEIGVCRAQSAIPILEACPEIEKYYMVDPKLMPEIEEAMDRFACTRFLQMTSEEASQQFGNSVKIMFGKPILLNKLVDMVIIDAIHDYKNVFRDTTLWKPLVREGGIMSWHDYENKRFPGVKQAVMEIFDEALIKTIPVKMCKVAWIVL